MGKYILKTLKMIYLQCTSVHIFCVVIYSHIMGKFVTVVEIAHALNISHSTVSRALNDHPKISSKTKQKVKELAKQMGYYANSTASLLSSGNSQLIAVIVPDMSIHFFSKIITSIEQVLKESNYSLLLFNSNESLEDEKRAVENCLKHRVDGVLCAISMQTTYFEHFNKLLKYEIPLVFFDRVSNFLPVPKVIANDYQAAYNATSHLLQSGRKCIAHITGSKHLNNSNNRLYGYLDALTDHNTKVDEHLIHYYEFKPSSIETFLKKAITKYPDLDGIFVFNDYVANYAINVLTKLGKKIPDDIHIIGFSDEPVATYMSPQLSTVQQVADKIGKISAQKILSIIKNDEPLINEKILIESELILRETTGKV